ncbi:MAG: hypothetical protein RIQ60_3227 [Pseudomonadota bacterium]|jgi:ornithine cyclodeaminase
MQIHTAQATRDALPFDRLIPTLRAMFISGCRVPPRHVHVVGDEAAGGGFTSLIMPAWLDAPQPPGDAGPGPGAGAGAGVDATPRSCYGVKIINIAPGNAALGLPGLHASYLLHDGRTGVPLALLDGDQITARRTAAASALAAGWLARPDARRLLVVGAGRIAALLPEAYRVVRDIGPVTVWARSPARAEALAAQWRSQGLDASAVHDLPSAVAAADIVSCATLATEPVILGRWLRPGSHLDLIGSFTPAMREADDDCVTGATVCVDTEEALLKSGDLIGPLARGVLRAEDLCANTLAALARGQAPGRRSAQERTVFKSVGTALEDLAAAMLVLQAQSRGA